MKSLHQLTLLLVLTSLGCGGDDAFPIANRCEPVADCPEVPVRCSPDRACDNMTVCRGGFCRELSWPYVAVVSATDGELDLLRTDSPGPDLDAIELIQGDDSTFATRVDVFRIGQPSASNDYNNAGVLTGTNDAVPSDGGVCDLGVRAGLFSMGDTRGYVMVSFGGLQLQSGDTIRVWEANSSSCDNIDAPNADSYAVYVGHENADLEAFVPLSGLNSDDWLLVGRAPSGGVSEFRIELPEPTEDQ